MRVARVFGIPVRIDWSWLLIFPLLVWTLSAPLGPFGPVSAQWRLPVAALAALALFACVLIHETAHALTARRFGIGTKEIDLFAFGGVSQLEGAPRTPGQQAQIALAGPLTSLLLSFFFGALSALSGMPAAAQTVVSYLCIVNGALAIFNLLPAFPMDGGRIFHAAVWMITGDRVRSTRIAAGAGTVIGSLAAAGGLVLIFRGAVIDGMWIALLSWFLMRAAQTELATEVAITPLAQLTAADIADAAPEPVEPDLSCAAALKTMNLHRRRAVPVAVRKRFLGLLTLADFNKLTRDAAGVYVTSIMTPLDELVTIPASVPALDAFKLLSQSGYRQIPVVDENLALCGFISHETVARALAFGLEQARTAGPALSRLN